MLVIQDVLERGEREKGQVTEANAEADAGRTGGPQRRKRGTNTGASTQAKYSCLTQVKPHGALELLLLVFGTI
jgi:hypothetical protein